MDQERSCIREGNHDEQNSWFGEVNTFGHISFISPVCSPEPVAGRSLYPGPHRGVTFLYFGWCRAAKGVLDAIQ